MSEIAELRRLIFTATQELTTKMETARLEKLSRFEKLVVMRHGPARLTLLTENLDEYSTTCRDVTSWKLEASIRAQSYNADITPSEGVDPDASLVKLSRIKRECQHELTDEIPKLRELAERLVALKQNYEDIMASTPKSSWFNAPAD